MKYIAIEGIDGAGKATQAEMLREYLEECGVHTLVASFPRYEGVCGKAISAYLAGAYGDPVTVHPYMASALFTVDRAAFFASGIPREYSCVVLDRFGLSNLAHQGAKIAEVSSREAFITHQIGVERSLGIPEPNLTILLSIDADESVERTAERAKQIGATQDSHETNQEYLDKVRAVYLDVAIIQNIPVVDCTGKSRRAIHEEIVEIVKERGLV